MPNFSRSVCDTVPPYVAPVLQDAMQHDKCSAYRKHEFFQLLYSLRKVQSSSVSSPQDIPLLKPRGIKGMLATCLYAASPVSYANAQSTSARCAVALPLSTDVPSTTLPALRKVWTRAFAHLPRLLDPFSFPSASALAPQADRVPTAGMSVLECQTGVERAVFMQLLDTLGDAAQDSTTSRILAGFLAKKDLMLAAFPREKMAKRALLMQTQQRQARVDAQYVAQHCKIRTKTVRGDVIGDSLLVAGEYVRNPSRAVVEKIYEKIQSGESMSETAVTVMEIVNMAENIILAFFTHGSYPIIKFASAKALNVAGHVRNEEWTCLGWEFSGEQIANFLLDTETGLLGRVPESVPAVLSKAEAFRPEGLFVQENLHSGIHTEKHMAISCDGVEVLIKEALPGQFFSYHPHSLDPAQWERPVFFDQQTQQIFLMILFPLGRDCVSRSVTVETLFFCTEKNKYCNTT